MTHSYSVGWNACKDVYMCSVVRGSNDVAMSFHVYYSDNIRYTDTCYSSQNLCGCVGIKSSSNCILNTNYSQQEYDQLLLKIRDHMRSTGEWGSFFPYSHSPFAYNESSAGDFMPLDTQGVQKR